MLQLINEPVMKGMRLQLKETWHAKLMAFSRATKFPYEFVLVGKKRLEKTLYYLFEEVKEGPCKKTSLALTDFMMQYCRAVEVPDTNCGFSFKEYLPLEDTQILMTSTRNRNIVIPAILKVDCELVAIDGDPYITLSLRLNYMNGGGFADVQDYASGTQKVTWKFLLHDDESYMTDYEKMFRDTIIHKQYVMRSAEKLCQYLLQEKAFEHAKMLMERAKVHDNSKMSSLDEMHALSRIINDKTTLKDPNRQLGPIQKDAIELHWKNNTHHPEHFASPIDMSKLDIMEMCCDWHARSTQYHTDFLMFVKTQQEKRFHFPDWMFCEIYHYCEVLAASS